MSQPRLFIAERMGDWAVAWRKACREVGLPLSELRSVAECEEQLPEHSGSMLAIATELVAGEALLALIRRLKTAAPSVRLLVLAEPTDEAACLYREAGAVLVVCSRVEVPAAMELVRRHVSSIPPVDVSLREATWQRLPWK